MHDPRDAAERAGLSRTSGLCTKIERLQEMRDRSSGLVAVMFRRGLMTMTPLPRDLVAMAVAGRAD